MNNENKKHLLHQNFYIDIFSVIFKIFLIVFIFILLFVLLQRTLFSRADSQCKDTWWRRCQGSLRPLIKTSVVSRFIVRYLSKTNKYTFSIISNHILNLMPHWCQWCLIKYCDWNDGLKWCPSLLAIFNQLLRLR